MSQTKVQKYKLKTEEYLGWREKGKRGIVLSNHSFGFTYRKIPCTPFKFRPFRGRQLTLIKMSGWGIDDISGLGVSGRVWTNMGGREGKVLREHTYCSKEGLINQYTSR